MMIRVNRRLARAVEQRGQPLYRTAGEIGIPPSTLGEIINGYRVPNERHRKKLTEFFGEDLLEDEET
jgi:hypothetical protein